MKKGFFVFVITLIMAGSCNKPDSISSLHPKTTAAKTATAKTASLLSAPSTLVVSTLISNDTIGLPGIAVDAAGNIYVSDNISLCIRKITPAGVVSVLAGGAPPSTDPNPGPDGPPIDGPGNKARFGSPQGIAVDAAGNVYVADAGFNRIRKVGPDGFVSTLAGSGPTCCSSSAGFRDGSPVNSKFNLPNAVAVDDAGNVYVADGGNARIRVVSPGSVTTLAGNGITGSIDSTGTAAEFSFPTGIALDAAGNVYVADFGNHRVRKITPARRVSTLAGSSTSGSADGIGSAAQFKQPYHLTVDAAGNVYVTDPGSFRIRKITPGGAVNTFAGYGTSGSTDGAAASAQFAGPSGIAVDASGNVFVSDGSRVRKVSLTSAPGVYTLAGNGSAAFANGTGAAALFNSPAGVVTDASGNVYIADATNQRIRLMTPGGTVSTFAGGAGGFRDGTGIAARFDAPTGLAMDNAGNIYVADQINQRIRKITPAGVVSTIAGNGTRGYIEGPGQGAEFKYPTGIAVDASGNVYVADVENAAIRKITPAGVVSTLAGGTQGFADNTGAAAKFNFPEGIALDASGNVYVADKFNHRIRKVTPDGVVTTLAGTGKAGYADGAAAVAQFSSPIGLAIDASGNILVVDPGNQRIRKITPGGVVSTLAGSGIAGASDGIYGLAQFNNPFGITVDASGVVYVGDQGNNRIRAIK